MFIQIPLLLFIKNDINNFAHKYNEWASLVKPNVLNKEELRLWNEVKQEWKEFQKIMDEYYGN